MRCSVRVQWNWGSSSREALNRPHALSPCWETRYGNWPPLAGALCWAEWHVWVNSHREEKFGPLLESVPRILRCIESRRACGSWTNIGPRKLLGGRHAVNILPSPKSAAFPKTARPYDHWALGRYHWSKIHSQAFPHPKPSSQVKTFLLYKWYFLQDDVSSTPPLHSLLVDISRIIFHIHKVTDIYTIHTEKNVTQFIFRFLYWDLKYCYCFGDQLLCSFWSGTHTVISVVPSSCDRVGDSLCWWWHRRWWWRGQPWGWVQWRRELINMLSR